MLILIFLVHSCYASELPQIHPSTQGIAATRELRCSMSVRHNSTLTVVNVLDVFNNTYTTKEKVTEQVDIVQSEQQDHKVLHL